MPDRLHLLHGALVRSRSWVVSGALTGWGNPLVPLLDCVGFLTLDRATRMARLLAREVAHHGPRIAAGGDMTEGHRIFLELAAAYDSAGPEQRSRVQHEEWLATLPCPVLRLDSARPVEALAADVLAAVQ